VEQIRHPSREIVWCSMATPPMHPGMDGPRYTVIVKSPPARSSLGVAASHMPW
jgi:hypothetical protein